VQKSVLLAALKAEIQRQEFSTFVDAPLSIAQGGKGVVVMLSGVQKGIWNDAEVYRPYH
jgi:hypothetical protein